MRDKPISVIKTLFGNSESLPWLNELFCAMCRYKWYHKSDRCMRPVNVPYAIKMIHDSDRVLHQLRAFCCVLSLMRPSFMVIYNYSNK